MSVAVLELFYDTVHKKPIARNFWEVEFFVASFSLAGVFRGKVMNFYCHTFVRLFCIFTEEEFLFLYNS